MEDKFVIARGQCLRVEVKSVDPRNPDMVITERLSANTVSVVTGGVLVVECIDNTIFIASPFVYREVEIKH